MVAPKIWLHFSGHTMVTLFLMKNSSLFWFFGDGFTRPPRSVPAGFEFGLRASSGFCSSKIFGLRAHRALKKPGPTGGLQFSKARPSPNTYLAFYVGYFNAEIELCEIDEFWKVLACRIIFHSCFSMKFRDFTNFRTFIFSRSWQKFSFQLFKKNWLFFISPKIFKLQKPGDAQSPNSKPAGTGRAIFRKKIVTF